MLVSSFRYPILLTSDTHFTDNPLDEYRFGLFPWMREIIEGNGVNTVIIGGDLTDAKDEHNARLVNRIVTNLRSLKVPVVINMGNHDYELAAHPFFRFLNEVDDLLFVTAPTRLGDWVILPYSKERPLPGLDLVDRSTTHCLLHQTFDGARASNGQTMASKLLADALPHARTCRYLSGDIHVPQMLGGVEYVGSPYHVHFGDRFSPSLMLIRSPRVKPVRHTWEGLHRFSTTIDSVKQLDELDVRKGDQLKVRLQLSRADLPDWNKHKQDVQGWCDRHGATLCAVELIQPKARRQLAEKREAGVRSASFEVVLERYADFKHLTDEEFELGLELGRED